MKAYSYKTKAGVRWYYRVYIGGKPIVKRGFTDKKSALKAAREYSKIFDSSVSSFDDVRFNELCRLYLDHYRQKVKPSTFCSVHNIFKRHIIGRVGNLPISRISYKDMELWRSYIGQLAYKKKNYLISLMVEVFEYAAVFLGINNTNAKKLLPFRDYSIVSPVDTRSYLSFDDFRKLISEVEDNTFYLLFVLAYFTGLRISEARGLQVKCLVGNRLNVYQQALCKVGEGKTVLSSLKTKDSVGYYLLPDFLTALLVDHIHINELGQDDFIFFKSDKSVPMGENTINRYLQRAAERAGLVGVHFHLFRHSEAILLNAKGINSNAIAKYLRHSSDAVTKKYYMDETDQDRKQIKELLEGLGRGLVPRKIVSQAYHIKKKAL